MISVLLMIQGCAYTIKTGDIPQLKTGSPLHAIKPLLFEIEEFADERQVMDKYKDDEIRMKKNYVGFWTRAILIDRNVTGIITEAISSELKRNGHSVSNSSDGNKNVDIVIKGAVTKFYFFAVNKVEGCVEAKIAVISNKDSAKTFIKTYRGNVPTNWRVPGGYGGINKLLNQALLDMVEDFTTDTEFLDLLRGIKKS